MILVTGGTGLVGAHLLFDLAKKDVKIKALFRTEKKIEVVKKVFSYYHEAPHQLFDKITWVQGDITDIPSLETAFEGVSLVYHCAALISFDPGDYETLLKINVEGTANIVNLCLAHKVHKLCYVSSIAAIGRSNGTAEATEESEWSTTDANVYALTKYAAEMEVWRGTQEGLPVVIVNPGVILGPGFWDSGSGVLFTTAAKKYSYYPPGGTACISVHDTVKMMIQLMDSSIQNERFIAISKNISYQQILTEITRRWEMKPPKKPLKMWHLEILWRLDWFKNLLTQNGRKLTKVAVHSLKYPRVYSNQKIKNSLDFEFEALEDTFEFVCQKFKEERL